MEILYQCDWTIVGRKDNPVNNVYFFVLNTYQLLNNECFLVFLWLVYVCGHSWLDV